MIRSISCFLIIIPLLLQGASAKAVAEEADTPKDIGTAEIIQGTVICISEPAILRGHFVLGEILFKETENGNFRIVHYFCSTEGVKTEMATRLAVLNEDISLCVDNYDRHRKIMFRLAQTYIKQNQIKKLGLEKEFANAKEYLAIFPLPAKYGRYDVPLNVTDDSEKKLPTKKSSTP